MHLGRHLCRPQGKAACESLQLFSTSQIQCIPCFQGAGSSGLRLIIHTLIPTLTWGPQDSGSKQLGEQGAFGRVRERLLA